MRDSNEEKSRKADRERGRSLHSERPRLPQPMAHLPKLDFDPNKPYESKLAVSQPAELPKGPPKPKRQVAALLGGRIKPDA